MVGCIQRVSPRWHKYTLSPLLPSLNHSDACPRSRNVMLTRLTIWHHCKVHCVACRFLMYRSGSLLSNLALNKCEHSFEVIRDLKYPYFPALCFAKISHIFVILCSLTAGIFFQQKSHLSLSVN